MSGAEGDRRQRARLIAALACGLALTAGFVVVVAWMPRDLAGFAGREIGRTCEGAEELDIVALEVAGTGARAEDVVARAPDIDCARAMAREAVRRDSLFIVAYVAVVVFWCSWGARNFRSRKMRTTGVVSAVFAAVAGLLDLVENAGLQRVLDRRSSDAGWTAAASLAKWALLVVVVGYACSALAVAGARLVALLQGKVLPRDPRPVPEEAEWNVTAFAADRLREVNDLDANAARRQRWWWHSRRPTPTAWTSQQGRAEPVVGIALSGGGIRSACFNLGTLQACLATLDRFVYVSDGGHHDNLGLIELLRRRCDVILCFDASNDKPGAPVKTFDDVRARAFDELGVKLDPCDGAEDEALHAGGGAVAAYRIHYPELPAPPGATGDGLPGGRGVLVFGKCTVAGATLDWGEGERPGKFPRDGTASLWFSERRLREYQGLGQRVASQAIARLARVPSAPQVPDA